MLEHETILEQCWNMKRCFNNAGTMLKQGWNNAGTMLEQCWNNAGTILEQCWNNENDAVTMMEQC